MTKAEEDFYGFLDRQTDLQPAVIKNKIQQEGKRKMAKPKQERLPGTGDAAVNVLEGLAIEYQECGTRRKQLKADLLAEMKKLKKKLYEYNGLEITVVDGSEGIRVKNTREEKEEEG